MTRDPIISMAREAGIIDFRDAEEDPHVAQMVDFLESFANLVEAVARAEEREACAQIADDFENHALEAMARAKGIRARDVFSALAQEAHRLAIAIRARKDNT